MVRWTRTPIIDPIHNGEDIMYGVDYSQKSAPRNKFASYLEYFVRD